MYEQRKKFDIFIYSEDDILFKKKNFFYWLKYKDECIKNRYNIGFLRIEKKKITIKFIQVIKLEI